VTRGKWSADAMCGARGSGSMAGDVGVMLGGSARPTAATLPCFGAEEGRKGRVGQKAEQAGRVAGPRGASKASWAKRPNRPTELLGRTLKNKPFQNKNKNLNLPRLWKFVQGHFGGILTQGFFVNSFRILKNF
jgi:hypothetical protein